MSESYTSPWQEYANGQRVKLEPSDTLDHTHLFILVRDRYTVDDIAHPYHLWIDEQYECECGDIITDGRLIERLYAGYQ